MNKDRIVGAETEGPLSAGVTEVLDEARLPAEGRVDGAEGDHQKAIGVLKDTLSKADARLIAEVNKPEATLQAVGVLKDSQRE